MYILGGWNNFKSHIFQTKAIKKSQVGLSANEWKLKNSQQNEGFKDEAKREKKGEEMVWTMDTHMGFLDNSSFKNSIVFYK